MLSSTKRKLPRNTPVSSAKKPHVRQDQGENPIFQKRDLKKPLVKPVIKFDPSISMRFQPPPLTFDRIGIQMPKILLPDPQKVDLSKWAVIACDQYTSEPDYWQRLQGHVGQNPSMLNLIYPEAFLEEPKAQKAARIQHINQAMKQYLESGVLTEQNPGFVFVTRTLPNGKLRKGLIASVDLEKYDYTKGAKSLIRPSEATVEDRIPPRLAVRQNASLESPHILLLINDPRKTVVEPLERSQGNTLLYDFDLHLDHPQHLTGHQVPAQNVRTLVGALENLISQKDPMLFVVGDGNHSLATARTHWLKIKATLSPEAQKIHPARFALVEIMNLHDDSLVFEPIHRICKNVDCKAMLAAMTQFYQGRAEIEFESCNVADIPKRMQALKQDKTKQYIAYLSGKEGGIMTITKSPYAIEVATLQNFLDNFLLQHKEVGIDYIHDDDKLVKLSQQPKTAGFLLPSMDKFDLFPCILKDGVLPRKTFSMGHAEEKRVYMECKKIV